MSKDLVKEEISPEIINSLILTGDMSKLSAQQQTQYYTAVCKSVGINPLTQPFAIITLQGKKTLYATKGCTQQLADTRKISTEIRERKTVDSVYQVSCRATDSTGRYTDDDGIVSIVGLKGVELANAMLKAVTKAKRRAVLALCGLGISDESEVEDMVQHPASEQKQDPSKSRVENLVDSQVEEAVTSPIKETKDEAKENPTTDSKKQEVKENDKHKETKKKSEPKTSSSVSSVLTIQGIIEGQPRSGVVDGKTKYLFKIKDKEYGTFDTDIVAKVMEVVDLQQDKPPGILIEFTYKERESTKTSGKIFYDITGFRQVTIDEVEVPI